MFWARGWKWEWGGGSGGGGMRAAGGGISEVVLTKIPNLICFSWGGGGGGGRGVSFLNWQRIQI